MNCKADGQHCDLAMEALRASQAAYQALSMTGAFERLALKYSQHFPFWSSQIDQVKSAGCCVM